MNQEHGPYRGQLELLQVTGNCAVNRVVRTLYGRGVLI